MDYTKRLDKVQRDTVIDNVNQVKVIVHDPSSFINELGIQQQQFYSIGWLCHFNVFAALPSPPDALSYAEVASKTSVPISTLRSVARMVMTAGLLCETDDGKLSHNLLSKQFAEDNNMMVQLLHLVDYTVPVMAGFAKATEKWGDTTALNETAYSLVNQTDLSFFGHLKSRPELNRRFDNYMKSRAVSHLGSRAEYLLEAFDWESLGAATVVDVSAISWPFRSGSF